MTSRQMNRWTIALVLFVVFLMIVLGSSARADGPQPPTSGDTPLQEGGWTVAFIVIGLTLVVLAIKDWIKKRGE